MDENLLGMLNTLRTASRAEMLLAIRETQRAERERADVTGTWMGYNDKGQGLVRYQGRIYECEVLSRTCRQKFSPVNLRRTPSGNFVDWQ